MKNSKIKQYLLTIIIQILVITIHTICSFYAFKLEAVALEPVKYILPLGAALLCIDIICELIIFRGCFKKDDSEATHNE